jgi:hypothetical protein
MGDTTSESASKRINVLTLGNPHRFLVIDTSTNAQLVQMAVEYVVYRRC